MQILRADILAAGATYGLAPDVAVVVLDDGSARIFDMGGHLYGVPPVGAEMLRRTLEQGTTAAACDVAAAYAAEPARVAADLRTFIDDLLGKGILRRHGAAPRPTRRARCAAALALLVPSLLSARLSPGMRASLLLVLARLSFLLSGWRDTVRAWRDRVPRATAVAADAARIDAVVRNAAATLVVGADCKDRALCCWAMARAAGLPATLVVGVEFHPLAGHCWCEIGDALLGDEVETVRRYTQIFRYD